MKPFSHNLDDPWLNKFELWFKDYKNWMADLNSYTIDCLISPFNDPDFFDQLLLNGNNTGPYIQLGAVYRLLNEYEHILMVPDIYDAVTQFKKKLLTRDILSVTDNMLSNAPSIYNGILGVPWCKVDSAMHYTEQIYDDLYQPQLLNELRSHFIKTDLFGVQLFHATATPFETLSHTVSLGHSEYEQFNSSMLQFKFKKDRLVNLNLQDMFISSAFNNLYSPGGRLYAYWIKTNPTFPQMLEYFIYIAPKLTNFNTDASIILNDIGLSYPGQHKQLELLRNILNSDICADALFDSLTCAENAKTAELPWLD